MKKPPDILNSKIKKIRIELPHYSFSHSASGDSPHAFIGRERSREKLKKVIEDSPDEPGVYLIAGNRGVGKTSLVSWVINETSLKTKSNFIENFIYLLLFLFFVIGTLFCLQIFNTPEEHIIILVVALSLFFFLLFILICFFNEYRGKITKQIHGIHKKIYYCFVLVFKGIWNYIKNHNRLYLRINFGHKLNDEKDILRLITRTLSTEYYRYRRSFRRMFLRRVMVFSILFLFAYWFSDIIEDQNFYISIKNFLIQQKTGETIKDKDGLNDIFSTENSKIKTIVETNIGTVVKTTVETGIGTKISKNVSIFLITFDNIASEISKRVINLPKNILGCNEYINIDECKLLKIIFLRDYIFWLSFFLMYLFCKLLSRCTWIMNFFATHQIIKQRLKKLNSDITHSTEFENSININSKNIGPEIGTKTKKMRIVADAREIEKELQDILNDIQRIPVIMCRPNIVIVFDELDKVEPGYTDLEKENLQTKASLFSINAARERQTEILRILSNMKYFLSSTRAKFIFIAGREMFDFHLADVSERNNYIGSIFNVVILVPSFLTDHHTARKLLPQESSIASLPEEFVCRRLIPYDYPVESYDLRNYQKYLENVIYKTSKNKVQKKEIIQKVIAVLQQFIIYLAHVSKGAPKKMIQLFESFIEIHIERDENKNTLFIQRYHKSRHFLSFNYYKQYTIGIVAYLITPIFYRLAESNIKEHSDKLLVSSLRFVDFLFKFHKNSFSWKHLDMSPEMLEVNRAPELKSVAVDLLNYLAQIHINKSNFSLSEYKFDGLIANEIFAMAKTDEVFSALFSFSLDEMLPLKKHYQDLLEKKEKEYQKKKKTSEYIDAISSLQGVLGDLHYYDDELEEAESYYKSAVQALSKLEQKNENIGKIPLELLYVYVRNMLRLGIIYEKRKQYDFAYLTYGEICKWIIQKRDNRICSPRLSCYKNISPYSYDMFFKNITYEGLKMLYLPFIAKLQILEKSHVGGIVSKHLKQMDEEFESLTLVIDPEGGRLLKAEFYSRVADVLYYKNSDLKCKKKEERKNDKEKFKCSENSDVMDILPEKCSCTACYYYHKALSILLKLDKINIIDEDTVKKLLYKSIKQLYNKDKQDSDNFNMKFCTILARILSDWGNVFFSCDINVKTEENINNSKKNKCYIYDEKCDTLLNENHNNFLDNCIKYMESEKENEDSFSLEINQLKNKKDIAFAMYSISSVAYRKASLNKRSSYQIYKMLCLFKDYEINYEELKTCIEQLSEQAIHYLWYANDDLNVLELNKRKKDFDRTTIKDDNYIPLQNILVDTEITRIRVLVKELKLKSEINNKIIKDPKDLKKYYDMRITSPYRINYSIVARIYRLRLKSKVNYESYKKILEKSVIQKDIREEKFIVEGKEFKNLFGNDYCKEVVKDIFGEKFDIIQVFENLIADSIYCLIDIAQLIETMDETYLFPHSFQGSVHEHLSFWIRQYETYERDFYEENKDVSRIKEYLKQYLDDEWREQLSGYRENQRALSYYQKSLEMHNEGRAYHNMIDTMCYVRDDFNDRSDHFNIAEERHLIVNGKINEKIDKIKDIYKKSKLYDVDNYFEKVDDVENDTTFI